MWIKKEGHILWGFGEVEFWCKSIRIDIVVINKINIL